MEYAKLKYIKLKVEKDVDKQENNLGCCRTGWLIG